MTSTDARVLRDWIATALDGKSQRTRQGYSEAAQQLFAYLDANGYPTELAAIRPMHLRAYYATLRARGVSQNTVAVRSPKYVTFFL